MAIVDEGELALTLVPDVQVFQRQLIEEARGQVNGALPRSRPARAADPVLPVLAVVEEFLCLVSLVFF